MIGCFLTGLQKCFGGWYRVVGRIRLISFAFFGEIRGFRK